MKNDALVLQTVRKSLKTVNLTCGDFEGTLESQLDGPIGMEGIEGAERSVKQDRQEIIKTQRECWMDESTRSGCDSPTNTGTKLIDKRGFQPT